MSKVFLNRSFYKKEALDQAIADFRGIAKISLLDANFNVEIIADVPNLESEFSNYVLALMKNMRLV